MFGNSEYAEIIDTALSEAVFPITPRNLYDPIRYIISLSGKRIRPQLVFMGADIFGYQNMSHLIPASKAVEYFHNFSLIHDDIMDEAPLRRGKATVHQKWNNSVAILSGDALLIKAYEELAKGPTDSIPILLKKFNQIALEVCEGQQMDMDFEDRNDVKEEEYIDMIRLKTSVLLGGALEFGAIIAGATVLDRKRIYEFGVNLGIAFQLQDDILDAYGDTITFGKQVGGDIKVNKKTILYVLLKKAISDSDIEHFEQALSLGGEDFSLKFIAMMGLYEKYNVLKMANELKEHYTNLAYDNLQKIDVPMDSKNMLYALADELMHRLR